MDEQLKKRSMHGFFWRFLQNTSAQLMSFIIQIVLARILLPEDYGLIALTTVFIAISNVFVQSGLTSGLVQKKEISEVDKSSMFFISVGLGLILYWTLFFISPLISSFYETPELSNVLRVQSITVVLSSISSVSIALIQRELKFRKTFFISVIGYLAQGILGITLALRGYGVWALVFGSLAYNFVYSVGNIIFCRWLPKLVFSFKKVFGLIVFSTNVLLSNLFSTLSTSIRSLMVGKAYNQEVLGLYDKGNQFPIVVMNGFDGALSAVLYSSLSKIQDERERLLAYLRKTIKISIFVTAPIMFGLAAVSHPMISFLLNQKWIGCVPYLMVYCGICIFWPLNAKIHALNAVGKSKITFLINAISVGINLGIMFVLIRFNIIVFAIGTLIGNFLCLVFPAIASKKYLKYSLIDQIIDVLPTYLSGAAMFAIVYKASTIITFHPALELCILVPMGVIIYLFLSIGFHLEGMDYLIRYAKVFLKRRKNNG